MTYTFKETTLFLLITAGISLVGNFVGKGIGIFQAMPGVLILVAISLIGITLGKLIPLKIPSVAYIVTLSTILTVPGVPGSAVVSEYVSKVDFLALCTPILAYAGIYTGKNIDTLKKTGWRIVLLAIFVIFGTFIGSAVIANIVLKLLGQI